MLFTFHPSKEQGAQIKRLEWTTSEVLNVLSERIEAGVKITISSPLDRESFSVIAREALENWEEARGVSCWHRDLETALRGLAFYLTKVNPDWPDTPFLGQADDVDW
jgi:hypothetical protein